MTINVADMERKRARQRETETKIVSLESRENEKDKMVNFKKNFGFKSKYLQLQSL